VIDGDQNDGGGFTAIEGDNAIEADPLFVDTDDFHLQATSPAKHTCDSSVWQGTPNISDYDGVAITDESGNIVVSGGVVSCGAYEYETTVGIILKSILIKSITIN